ncbi:hypothetical protein CK240_08610 [Paracoccus salipaludis]|uniref:Uncharacterized protein n=1 Tax=Paracoccus salipaludis TaxID=2032623 RepID=A0A2A2GIT7_9RHOB|nr:hypothetical protein CK240_08610 [Paracoccus salipaludis]
MSWRGPMADSRSAMPSAAACLSAGPPGWPPPMTTPWTSWPMRTSAAMQRAKAAWSFIGWLRPTLPTISRPGGIPASADSRARACGSGLNSSQSMALGISRSRASDSPCLRCWSRATLEQ